VDLAGCFDTSLPNHSHRIHPGSADRAVLTARMGELVRECYGKDFGSDISAQGIFLQLMVQLNRMVLQTGSLQQERQLSPLVQKALQHIANHIGEDMSLDSIASACYVSKYHLSHAFSREVGISVYRYIMIKRLLMARQLLAAGEPAGQVCISCGFSDYTSFYRAFKAEYGISPGAFGTE
jgi:AraC-like DNA-binding protein